MKRMAGKTGRVPGKKVRCPGGYLAFVPDPLPPELNWTPKLVTALSDADRLIGRLAGEGGKLPNPHLPMRPFVAREAVLSSRIEGTQATLGELLADSAGASVERSPHDLREVANYVVALEHGIRRLEHLPLSLRLIREIHGKLMAGVQGNVATPGEFRRTRNWIGQAGSTPATATCIPPPPAGMTACLGDLERFLHETVLPPLVQVALVHYQFEAIHPFLDGNGRVGRLLVSLFLVQRGILPTPLLCLSAFFEATRREYYEGLQGVTERGEWERWLGYFLNGVARQSEDALGRAKRINRQLSTWRLEIAGISSKTPVLLLERLSANPFQTVRMAAREMGLAFTTVQRAMEKLESLSIVSEVSGGKRDRVYCAKALMEILEEPAKLAP